MVFSVQDCRPRNSRVTYETATITDTTLSLATPYGTVPFSGTIALMPLSSGCDSCDGVLILEFATGTLTGQYWVNGRSILSLDTVTLQKRKYKVWYFTGKTVYWAAAQFSAMCGNCGCDHCVKIWDVDDTTTTFESLAESELNAPGFEEMIPLAYQAQQTSKSSQVCDDNIQFLDLNTDIKSI